ncbi:MAG: glycosyl hydrolase family 95 catalytic domain-containing protein [Acidobacteriota bacterium]
MKGYSRRTFLTTAGLAASGLASQRFTFESPAIAENSKARGRSQPESELGRLISASDLVYTRPVPRSEEGIPVGNGRMGSLVWTSSNQLHFQINRVDVYANNCQTNSFVEVHDDYCGGCAFLDIAFEGQPFPESGFRQHLSVYDGSLAIDGDGVSIRVAPCMEQDAFAIVIDRHPGAERRVSVTLRMLRYETTFFGRRTELLAEEHALRVPHRSQTATSQLVPDGQRIGLTQEFREGKFCAKSAVVAAMPGAPAAAEILNDTDIRLSTDQAGSVTILVASAATMEADEDVAAAAFGQLDAAAGQSAAELERQSEEWWHAFWSQGAVELHSEDGSAEYVQQNYHYFLYLMAATSRGAFPPKFNGMLWNTGGDLRMWGAQHWFTNLSCYYDALPATGRFELMDPMFRMYSSLFEAGERAARQQWGSSGVYIPETTYFDGLEELPEPIAAEMRELYLLQKPWEQRSDALMEFAEKKHPYSSRWNWIAIGNWQDGKYVIAERGSGPYGPTSHMFSSTAKIAWLYWQRYEYTLDRGWLQDCAYPMLRGAVEFYRNHPNLRKGEDGRYHMHWSNSGEPVFGVRDSLEDMVAMRSVAAAVLRAAAILDADRPMVPVWREFLEQLAPLPTSSDPEALQPPDYRGPRMFVNGLKPAIKADRVPTSWMPDINSLPMWFFDLCNVEATDREMLALAESTFEQLLQNGMEPRTAVGTLSMLPVAAASLGRADAVEQLLHAQMNQQPNARSPWYKQSGLLENRMTLGEGAQALHAEHLGRAAAALHRSLLQSNAPAPGEDPILHLFPALPRGWNARYTLWARGGFTITAVMRNGSAEHVELQSHAGSVCRLRNPFPGEGVQISRDSTRAEKLSGSLLRFATRQGEHIVLRRASNA